MHKRTTCCKTAGNDGDKKGRDSQNDSGATRPTVGDHRPLLRVHVLKDPQIARAEALPLE